MKIHDEMASKNTSWTGVHRVLEHARKTVISMGLLVGGATVFTAGGIGVAALTGVKSPMTEAFEKNLVEEMKDASYGWSETFSQHQLMNLVKAQVADEAFARELMEKDVADYVKGIPAARMQHLKIQEKELALTQEGSPERLALIEQHAAETAYFEDRMSSYVDGLRNDFDDRMKTMRDARAVMHVINASNDAPSMD